MGVYVSGHVYQYNTVSKGGTQGKIKNKLAFKRRKDFAKQMLFVRNHCGQTNDLLFSNYFQRQSGVVSLGKYTFSDMAQETGTHSLYSDLISFLFEYRPHGPIKCIGFAWQGLKRRDALEMAALRNCQKLCPYLTEPVPDGSKMDPPVAKTQLIRDNGSTSGITYLKKGENWLQLPFSHM